MSSAPCRYSVSTVDVFAHRSEVVAKEAVLKAAGCGLAASSADVRLRRDSLGLLVTGESELWLACEVVPLTVPSGYAGALALVSARHRARKTRAVRFSYGEHQRSRLR